MLISAVIGDIMPITAPGKMFLAIGVVLTGRDDMRTDSLPFLCTSCTYVFTVLFCII